MPSDMIVGIAWLYENLSNFICLLGMTGTEIGP